MKVEKIKIPEDWIVKWTFLEFFKKESLEKLKLCICKKALDSVV